MALSLEDTLCKDLTQKELVCVKPIISTFMEGELTTRQFIERFDQVLEKHRDSKKVEEENFTKYECDLVINALDAYGEIQEKLQEVWPKQTLGSQPYSAPCFEIQYDDSTTFDRLETLIAAESECELVCIDVPTSHSLLIFDKSDKTSVAIAKTLSVYNEYL